MNKFTTKILNKDFLTKDTAIFTLSEPHLDFKPGQFITFVLKHDGKPKPRSYSIFSPPQAEKTKLLVECIEGGIAGEQFKAATPDTEFTVLGPLGKFHFQEDHKKHILIATNTGLAPMHSILATHIDDDYDFTLIMGAKFREGLFLHEEFIALQESKSNFTYKPTISREDVDDIAYGRVQALIEIDTTAQYYICGNGAMVRDVANLLEEKGIKKEKINYEIFD